MFKTQIIRRSFSLFNRGLNSQVARSAARDGHETIRIQRVRFRKPLFNRSRLIRLGLAAGIGYAFARWLEETPEEEEERKREEEQLRQRRANKQAAKALGVDVIDDEDEDEEEPGVLIFVPTGFSRPQPRKFYKGSDPEWQEFVRIAPDRQRIERIRGELVGLIRHIAMKSPQYTLPLGKINPAAGTSWIEFKFPDGPPVEFEKPGIEITEDLTIRRSTRPINELAHHQLRSILIPTAVANSLYVDTMKKIGQTWQDFSVYLGWEDTRKTEVQSMIAPFIPPQLPAKPQATSTSSPKPSATSDAHQSSTSPSSSSSEKASAPPTPGDPVLERLGLVLPTLTLDLSTFRQAFRKEQKHSKMQPPRGTFLVSGLVEIIGEKARMTLDVAAAYDPKIDTFVMLRAQLRSFTQYQQDPKGGA